MNRREFLSTAALAVSLGMAGKPTQASHGADVFDVLPPDHPLQQTWKAWKALCLTPEGRVVDNFQGGVSHSEGQGYGLTLAAIFGDRAAAQAIMDWTTQNLDLRGDGLLCWRWRPDTTPHVDDPNNASDGDLFHAWGLMLWGRLEGRTELTERAGLIADALLEHCTAEHPDGSGRRYLLPGATGFRPDEGLVLNPSYAMPRALREIAQATGRSALATLAQDAEALTDELARAGLVPDWITLTADGPAPPPANLSRLSGYEAIRVPLFELWSDRAESPAVTGFARAVARVEQGTGAVTVFDPATQTVIERSPHPGYAAIAALATCAGSNRVGAAIPVFSADQPYYPATLHLMALVAQVVVFPRCVPI